VLLIGLIGSLLYVFSLKDIIRKAVFSSFQASHVTLLYQESLEKRLKNLKQEEYSMIFVGDIMLSRSVAGKIYEAQDPLFPFLRIAEFLRSADITFGNLEGPMSSRGVNQGSIYSFRDDPGTVNALTYAGFDVLSLANNHIFDWGSVALTDTLNLLHTNNIKTVGAGRDYNQANAPAIFNLEETKIAFLGYTNLYPKTLKADETSVGISDFDEPNIESQIRKAKQDADIVIVSFHWGTEYKKTSTQEQRELAHKMIDWGTDIIIGHHPHVVEEIEHYKNGWIAYSLGNFVFDQNFSKETMEGIAILTKIYNKKILDFSSIPIRINDDFQPHKVDL